jgi:hypothetical protein
MLFPLSQGFAFSQALHAVGGWDQVNAAYTRLPAASSEILSDEAYLADHTLPAPSITWKTPVIANRQPFWNDTLGQHGINLMMRRYNERDIAAKTAMGWRTDRWLAFAAQGKDQRGDAVWQTRWANADAAKTFLSSLTEWLKQHYSAELKDGQMTAKGRHLQARILKQDTDVVLIDASSTHFAKAALQWIEAQ